MLGGNLARFQLEKFIDRPKKHFSVTIFNNVDWGGDRLPEAIAVNLNRKVYHIKYDRYVVDQNGLWWCTLGRLPKVY